MTPPHTTLQHLPRWELRPRAATVIATLLAAGALVCAPPAGALTVSPLNGTPDASPQTQISFLGVAPSQIADVSVVGSHSGRHSGRLQAYASAPGASFLPSHPFSPNESVSVSAVVGPNRKRVSWGFSVARQLAIPAAAAAAALPPKAGAALSFVSRPDLQPPTVKVTAIAPGAEPGDIFLTPSHGYGQSGPMILDGSGALLWFQPAPPGTVAENLDLQEYEHQPVLVWWQGQIVNGVGYGIDEVYNSSYQQIAQIKAGNGYQADLHEAQITPQGSAFITAYSPIRANLSSGGGASDGTLQDAIVQEVDIKTGLVMFEWHAYGHASLAESQYARVSANIPWDFFHVNSISLDPSGDGNFLISARNTWTAYEISFHTGGILWRLGGSHSSFRMGPGTGTAWQHDVDWQPDGTLTIFDNGAVPKAHSQSRALRERIDWAHRTVSLISRTLHNPPILSGSQGDEQILANGDTFVGWGEAPFVTEYSPGGSVLFDAHLYAPGQSYRAYRYAWSAAPAAPPSMALKSAGGGAVTVYASWDGATGVSAWTIFAGQSPTELQPVATVPRSAFETSSTVAASGPVFMVQALDSAGHALASSAPAKL
jgi:hypothetical protein